MNAAATVEVSAGSIYEAVAQALRIFRDSDWIDDIGAVKRQS